jgi:hypothetical protein
MARLRFKRRKNEPKEDLQPVGFWHSERKPWLPHPAEAVAPDWSDSQRAAVIDYLLRPEDVAQYMGLSPCRICDRLVGSREFTDGTWVWPEGLVHYLDVHQVRPPDDFVAWVFANSKAAARRLPCPYSPGGSVGPLPEEARRHPHFERHRRALHPVERARRAAAQTAPEGEKREWFAAAPYSLQPLVARNSANVAAIRTARDLVLAEHCGDRLAALLALLKWFAAGSGVWRRRIAERFVVSLIEEFPRNLVVAAVESPLATDAVYEGAARYVSYWALGRKPGAACAWMPERFHARLRDAAAATGVQENVAALDTALGHTQKGFSFRNVDQLLGTVHGDWPTSRHGALAHRFAANPPPARVNGLANEPHVTRRAILGHGGSHWERPRWLL